MFHIILISFKQMKFLLKTKQKQTKKQTDRQTDGRTDRQTSRQKIKKLTSTNKEKKKTFKTQTR